MFFLEHMRHSLKSQKRSRATTGTEYALKKPAMRYENQIDHVEAVALLRRASFPAVFLEMAGCHDLYVNEAHGHEFGREEFNVLPRRSSALRLRFEHDHDERCYCEKVGSLFALSSNFCAFERAFHFLKEGSEDCTVTAFLAVSIKSQVREYKVYRIACRLVSQPHSRKLAMIALVVPIPQMRVQVQTSKTATEIQKLSSKLLWNDTELYSTSPTEIYHPTYAAFDEVLRKGESQLKRGLKIQTVKDGILARLYEVVDKIDYEPIKGFVQWTFRENKNAHQLIQEFAQTRGRLFDAVLVRDKVEGQIHQALDYEFARTCTRIENEVEWPLVRGRFNFTQLQAISSLQTSRKELLPADSGRTKECPPAQIGGTGVRIEKHTWEARLACYSEKKAVRFGSKEERNKALGLLWKDSEMKGMPRDYVDGLTLIVPAEAVPIFSRKGLAFKEFDVSN
jgi:hypothetical protein